MYILTRVGWCLVKNCGYYEGVLGFSVDMLVDHLKMIVNGLAISR
jgi:hypothetical protein